MSKSESVPKSEFLSSKVGQQLVKAHLNLSDLETSSDYYTVVVSVNLQFLKAEERT